MHSHSSDVSPNADPKCAMKSPKVSLSTSKHTHSRASIQRQNNRSLSDLDAVLLCTLWTMAVASSGEFIAMRALKSCALSCIDQDDIPQFRMPEQVAARARQRTDPSVPKRQISATCDFLLTYGLPAKRMSDSCLLYRIRAKGR